ncbi:filamin-A-interacting protein 1-like [Osmerus mordax]|uniref:filamin-A-interacting protein 1-like n=1 Tax=Osmerus mordax TaxID=8014 RepID=UPI00350F0D61
MRSKSNRVESSSNGVIGVPQTTHDINQEKEVSLPIKSLKVKIQPMNDEEEENVNSEKDSSLEECSESKDQESPGIMDLSKEDLLKLLGIMEGEVQAREDVIKVLKSGLVRPEVLEGHYGTVGPSSALQALQRDGLLTSTSPHNHSNVLQRPMTELDRLQKKHKDTYRRMLEQLLLAEKCHRRTVQELDSEKRKHADYMNKSDDFTNLLEQERERLKRLLENERAYQVRKETEHTTRLGKVREELVKLKSFALMLVDERQLHLEQMDHQNQRVQELSQQLQEREQALSNVSGQAVEESQRAERLEVQLREKSVELAQQHEEMAAKLAGQESQNRQLNAKLLGLAQKVEELEENNNALLKSEEELQKLRDKISNGDCGNSNFITELENLRKRVLEMEGKDEEITKTETQCKELRKRLKEEESSSRELKIEVGKLQKRMMELERLESVFNIGKAECTQLHAALEKEKELSKELSDELVALKIRMKELESSELRLEKSELGLKDDLSKLKSLTVVMVDERKSLMERIKLDEKKREDLSKIIKAEQGKVMDVTERLIEESKRLRKLKSEMEVKVGTLTRENGDLRTKLGYEMEKNKEVSFKMSQMNKRTDGLEEAEDTSRNVMKEQGTVSDSGGKEDNRVKELTFEIERLKNRLKQLEVVEGDLIKTEDQYDLLEKKFMTEQDKANILSQQVEEMRNQIAWNKAIEKGEAESLKGDLQQHCEMEEAKTRDLQADVIALKEKIHELMNKEDQLSQLQVDYTVLQQRFLEEEEKKKNMSIDILNLTKELEVTKRHSRSLRPSLNGRRMVDVPMTSTGVQTELLSNETAEEDTPAVFIRKSVQEENHIMSNLRQKGFKKHTEKAGGHERYPPPATDLSVKKSWIPWMRKKENSPQGTNLDKSLQVNGESLHSELTMSQKQGQPLHIRVTPDHQHSTATLEISSTTSEEFYSGSSLSPTTMGHPKSRITIIPTHTVTNTKGRTITGPRGPDRAKSPVTITTISRAKSPESSKTSSTSSGRPMSPISIMTVSTSVVSATSTSPEPHEMTMGRAMFKVTPEKQMVPTPIRKYNSNANIITTTEDNKIHIHLGSHFKGSSETSSTMMASKMVVRPVSTAMESKEMTLSTGTVLRSPRQSATAAVKNVQSKVMSSITITPVTTTVAKTSQAVPGHEAHPTRAGLTRIPMSRSLKTGKAMLGAMGIPSGVRMESRADSPSMRIELKKSTVSSTAFQNGGKG